MKQPEPDEFHILDEFIAQEIVIDGVPDNFSPSTDLNHAMLAVLRSGKQITVINNNYEWTVQMNNSADDVNSVQFTGEDLPLLICRAIKEFFTKDKTSVFEKVE